MSNLPIQYVKYLVRRFVLHTPYLDAPAPAYGLNLKVKTEDVIGRRIYKHGVYEPELTSFVTERIGFRSGDVVFDVGANVGWYSLLLDRVLPVDCQVFSFEPDPHNYSLLLENLARNDARKVRPQPMGVADKSGTMDLHLYSDRNLGRHSLLPLHEGPTVEVEVIALDEFCASHGLEERPVRLMKIDVEGFELAALTGASRLLSRCETVLMEFSPTYMRTVGLEPVALLCLLSEAGFRAREFVDGELAPADLDRLGRGDRHTNLIWQR